MSRGAEAAEEAVGQPDTALTPDQGSTSGSYGIARGGVQLRRIAATARQALLGMAAQKLGRPVADLETADGAVHVALRISKELKNAVIVSVICDRGDRYLTTGVFPD